MDTGLQSALFIGIMSLAGTIFTSTIFADYGHKTRAIAVLTLPATTFEKYLVAWLYSFLIFILIFIGSFYLILLVLINAKQVHGQTAEVFNVFDAHAGFEVFLLFALLQSIAFFGAIFYSKLHFIKTAFAFFIGIGLLILANKLLLTAFLGREAFPGMPYASLRFTDNGKDVMIKLTHQTDTVSLLMIGFLTVIFWTAAYYRLKEKQV